jgi:hypothetical protein
VNDEDEGFGEGSVIEDGEERKTLRGGAMNLDFLNGDAKNDRLPPQTVLVRVLRELEDDFTHYKGYVLFRGPRDFALKFSGGVGFTPS